MNGFENEAVGAQCRPGRHEPCRAKDRRNKGHVALVILQGDNLRLQEERIERETARVQREMSELEARQGRDGP